MKHRPYYSQVKRQIDSWDPAGLLVQGFPRSEYNYESEKVASAITVDMNDEEIAAIISDVFIKAFGDEYGFCEVVNCLDVARAIHEEIHKKWKR